MHSLLQPFKYNIPFYTEYMNDRQRYQKSLLDYANKKASEIDDEVQLPRSILSVPDGETLNLADWETVVKLLLRQSLVKSDYSTHHHIRDRWLEVKAHFEDPFLSYFNATKTYRLVQKSHEPFSSPTFEALFLEITRDNIVTETERSFLQEKAKVYGISKSLVDQALAESNPALHTFRNYVTEICRDGIVTIIERQFLEEKSKSYNIPSGLMESMIEEEIRISCHILSLRERKIFYELIIQCLIINFIYKENKQIRKVATAIENLSLSEDEVEMDRNISSLIEENRILIIDLVESKIGHKLPADLNQLEIADWVNAFGFSYLSHEEAIFRDANLTRFRNWDEYVIDPIEVLTQPSDGNLFRIYFNGFDYHFISSDSIRTLFTYQVNGTKIFVSISSLHSLYSNQNPQTLFKFIVTLIAAKMMDDRIAIDDFFDTLHFLQTKITKVDHE